MKREQIEQIILAVIGGAAMLVAAYHLVIKPQMAKLSAMTTDAKRIDAALSDAQRKVSALPRLKSSCRLLEQRVAAADQLLIGDGSFDGFLTVIKSSADTASLELRHVRPRDSLPVVDHGTAYQEHFVVVDTVAPYHVLGAWLAALEATSPYVRVHALSISSTPADGGFHPASVTLGFLAKRSSP